MRHPAEPHGSARPAGSSFRRACDGPIARRAQVELDRKRAWDSDDNHPATNVASPRAAIFIVHGLAWVAATDLRRKGARGERSRDCGTGGDRRGTSGGVARGGWPAGADRTGHPARIAEGHGIRRCASAERTRAGCVSEVHLLGVQMFPGRWLCCGRGREICGGERAVSGGGAPNRAIEIAAMNPRCRPSPTDRARASTVAYAWLRRFVSGEVGRDKSRPSAGIHLTSPRFFGRGREERAGGGAGRGVPMCRDAASVILSSSSRLPSVPPRVARHPPRA